MTLCIFHLDPNTVPSMSSTGALHVLLYGGDAVHPGTAAIGSQLRDLFLRFGIQPSATAVDLVSIALAVTAADTFILRAEAEDAWGRDIKIVLPLRSPDTWNKVQSQLERLLGFLSGDHWSFDFTSGGEDPPPNLAVKSHKPIVDISRSDVVSLFSGGLDSTISTLTLLNEKCRPLLVSHAYRGDAKVQQQIAERLPTNLERVSVNAWPTSSLTSEISMRTRSFIFIAIAALASDVRSRFRGGETTELHVPENGLIALNAPLTPRRIGSLSTRTTHPHYMASLQDVFDGVKLKVTIRNLYELQTKGEMVSSVSGYPKFDEIASETVSCGKWKRTNKQCGRCIPCLIRRSSLYAGCVDDFTDYQTSDLLCVLNNEQERDDLVAMLTAIRRLNIEKLDRWVARSGPLPLDPARRSALVDVHRRGISEVGNFLHDSGF